MVGVALWIAAARTWGLDGPQAALVTVATCGLPIIFWSLLVDKVHRSATTGIKWRVVRPWRGRAASA